MEKDKQGFLIPLLSLGLHPFPIWWSTVGLPWIFPGHHLLSKNWP